MYIKQLEVDNFKSFANEVTIPFLKGFTTISGPNGSGKSNIIDSILFGLGLSTSRALRAEKLFHLISTHTKKNEAYVKVTFDLEDGSNRDLEIGRRIKKTSSGFNSIYYMDDKICTLSQIHAKLEQYNITPNSYNVMMQGDVTSITSCSSFERRKIIDEIAGVADFDRRIEQAQGELETVESRVEKSLLILHEVNVRLEQLKDEREIALQYKNLKEEKTILEGQIDIVKYFEIKKSQNMVHENILEFETKKTDESKKLSHIIEELSQLKVQFEEISSNMKEKGELKQIELKKKAEEIKGSKERKINAVTFVEKNIFDNLKTIENAKNGIENLTLKIEDTKIKINEKNELIKNTQKQIDEQKIELNTILTEVAGISKCADNFIERRSHLRKLLEKNKDASLEIHKQRLPLENELQILRSGINKAKDALEKFEKIDVEFEIDKLKLQLIELEKEMKDYKIAQTNTLGELDKTKNEISDLTYNLRIATNKVAQMEGQRLAYEEANFGKSIDTVINSNLKGIHAPLAKLGEVEKEYSLALEIAMGNRMRNIVVDDELVASRAIEILKSANAGRVTFLPLNRIKKAPRSLNLPKNSGVIDFAINLIDFDEIYTDAFFLSLGETLIVEDYKTAQSLIGKYKMVTLNGELFDKSGAITGGSVGNIRNTLKFNQSQNDELEQYKQRLKQIENKLKDAESKKVNLETKLDKYRNEYSNILSEFSKCKIEYESLVKNKGENEVKIVENKKIIEENKIKIPDIEEKLNKLENDEIELNDECLKLNDEIDEIESQMSSSQLESLKKLTKDVEDKIKSFETEILKLNNDINDYNRDINFNREVIKTKHEQIEKLNKDNEILKSDKNRYNEEAKILDNELMSVNIEIQELSKNLWEYQHKRDELDENIREKTKVRDNTENKILRIEEQIESFKARRRELEPQIEEVKIKLETLKIDIKKIEPKEISIEEITSKINKISKKMESLEPVNMRSLITYDETVVRRDELQLKVDTLAKERREIMDRMVSYEKLKKDTFLETYEKININFHEIFNKLSDGEGTLILENTLEPFQGGLTIEAQPRDKKKQRLELMSGGEKSLTALAFVFAIQRYMPSPFYAFDEVDMHLDGINVEKLSQMILQQSKDTQFIVVSLRKPMIESANRTIGVTQKDKGITKVTGVKLRD